jgi:hypothetical protein
MLLYPRERCEASFDVTSLRSWLVMVLKEVVLNAILGENMFLYSLV